MADTPPQFDLDPALEGLIGWHLPADLSRPDLSAEERETLIDMIREDVLAMMTNLYQFALPLDTMRVDLDNLDGEHQWVVVDELDLPMLVTGDTVKVEGRVERVWKHQRTVRGLTFNPVKEGYKRDQLPPLQELFRLEAPATLGANTCQYRCDEDDGQTYGHDDEATLAPEGSFAHDVSEHQALSHDNNPPDQHQYLYIIGIDQATLLYRELSIPHTDLVTRVACGILLMREALRQIAYLNDLRWPPNTASLWKRTEELWQLCRWADVRAKFLIHNAVVMNLHDEDLESE